MKKRKLHKFTMMDFLVIIVIVFILAAMIIPMSRGRSHGRTPRIKCINNLKQMGTAVAMYYSDGSETMLPAQAGILDEKHQWTQLLDIEAHNLHCPAKHKVAKKNGYRIQRNIAGNSFENINHTDSGVIADESPHEIGGKFSELRGDGSVQTVIKPGLGN